MKAGTELAGRYRLDERLSQGGMGEVWLGFDQRLYRRVAVKLLLDHLLLSDEKGAGHLLARFRREGRAAARLSHSNIVTVHDFGEHREVHDGAERIYPFLVLEYLDGQDLKTLLSHQPGGLPVEDVLDYGAQICDGLGAAHDAGIVHRDIKPANLMLLADGTIKICDFGIARFRDATAFYAGSARIGTLAYMPPEQLDGQSIDHRADLYALGATLFHLVTGETVFPANDPRVLAFMHATKTPLPPSTIRSGVGVDVDHLIISLLAKSPDQRPSAASQTAADLRAALTRTRHRRIAYAERYLPPSLTSEFEVVQVLSLNTEIELVIRNGAGFEFVIKIYPRDFRADPQVSSQLVRIPTKHVVGILRTGGDKGHYFEIQEYVRGGTLADLLADGVPWPFEHVVKAIGQVAEALTALHDRGILHHCLTPINVLVRTSWPLDLALANFTLSHGIQVFEEDRLIDSDMSWLRYTAPECLTGERGRPADWWSLGILVLELILGRSPFHDMPDMAVLHLLMTATAMDTSVVADRRLRLVCDGLLQRDPARRWGAAQVAEWLCGGFAQAVDDL